MKATKINLSRGDYVKIDRDRGYGDRCFEIVGMDEKHFHLASDTPKQPIIIYKALCYVDTETMILSTKKRKSRAERIGITSGKSRLGR